MSQISQQKVSDSALGASGKTSIKKIVSWALWDWGTQPFNTVITTFVFAVYITSASFGKTNDTSQALSLSTTLAGIFIALAAPVLGQTADRSGKTVTVLKWLTWALAAVSAALFFIKPEPSYLWLGLALLAVGSVISEIAGVNYNSLLDEVANKTNVGRISGFGWGMGYLGGIVVLLVLYFGLIGPNIPALANNGLDIRVSMVICGLWIFGFTVPTFLNLRERPATQHNPIPGIDSWQSKKPRFLWSWLAPIVASYLALFSTIKNLWKQSRHTVFFLLASALFRDGLAGIFAFGAIIATGTFGFDANEVIIFGAAANIVAGLATIVISLLDDRIGPKKVIMGSLVALVLFGSGVFVFHDGEKIVFWIFGLALCMFVGPAQSASRSFLARLVPYGKSGEIFGLYATTGRVVSFMSPMFFGIAISFGEYLTGETNTQYWGILGIVIVLFAGLVVMIPVKEHSQHAQING